MFLQPRERGRLTAKGHGSARLHPHGNPVTGVCGTPRTAFPLRTRRLRTRPHRRDPGPNPRPCYPPNPQLSGGEIAPYTTYVEERPSIDAYIGILYLCHRWKLSSTKIIYQSFELLLRTEKEKKCDNQKLMERDRTAACSIPMSDMRLLLAGNPAGAGGPSPRRSSQSPEPATV